MSIRSLTICLLAVALGAAAPSAAQSQGPLAMQQARNQMVDEEIVAAGVKNERVIRAMRDTPRHEFVALTHRRQAYFDMALPIGESQTISPPFVVAYMTEALDPQPTDRVLEIGTGSGYQAAVLSPLVKEVYSIEIVPALGQNAARVLKRLRYDNVQTKVGDGFLGWAEHAPFDKIIVTCSPEMVPQPLVTQLREGGRMVIPVGERYQQTLYVMKKVDGKLVREALQPTLFVPMTGAAEQGRAVLPDPANPTVGNGGFEQTLGDPPIAAGWHYQRQMKLVGVEAPEGQSYALFSNTEPGRGSHALQGLAVDGRQAGRLEVAFMVRGQDVRPDPATRQMPMLVITFYDENRATVGQGGVGGWRGSFAWQRESRIVDVPAKAREAIVRIGLLGATGELAFDAIEIKAVRK
jgi:protein-L-isoaspartate(D-aspartate) O-methyltransferase